MEGKENDAAEGALRAKAALVLQEEVPVDGNLVAAL